MEQSQDHTQHDFPIIVRFKLTVVTAPVAVPPAFNPIIVRFKSQLNHDLVDVHLYFQFYNSSIQTWQKRVAFLVWHFFQSYNSSIQTASDVFCTHENS
jgi:hypothetical protein